MTLTQALNLALDPRTRTEGIEALALFAYIQAQNGDEARRAVCAGIILITFQEESPYTDLLPPIVESLLGSDAPPKAIVQLLCYTISKGQPLEWADYAIELAQWADKQVTP